MIGRFCGCIRSVTDTKAFPLVPASATSRERSASTAGARNKKFYNRSRSNATPQMKRRRRFLRLRDPTAVATFHVLADPVN